MDALATLALVNRLNGLTIATQNLFEELDLTPANADNQARNDDAQEGIVATLACMTDIIQDLRAKLDAASTEQLKAEIAK